MIASRNIPIRGTSAIIPQGCVFLRENRAIYILENPIADSHFVKVRIVTLRTCKVVTMGTTMPIVRQLLLESRTALKDGKAISKWHTVLSDEEIRHAFDESTRQGRRNKSGFRGEAEDFGRSATDGCRIGNRIYSTVGYWSHNGLNQSIR